MTITLDGTTGITTPGLTNTGTETIAALSVSGAVTLSGGTANGVGYLNGSKVLTTGTALTYNGTGLGIGVASASNPLHIDFDGTAARIVRGSAIGFVYNTGTTSTSSFRIQSNTGPVDIYTASGQPITFSAEAAEQMRLNSTGLGIGTSSPGFALDISQAAPRIRQTATTGTNSSLIQLVNTGGTAYVGLDNSSAGLSTAYALNLFHSGAYPIVFSTSGTERMRLDSSGNLGIGVTPSASTYKTVELTGIAITGINATDGRIYGNAYESGGGAVYKTSSFATLYKFNAGSHIWYNAPSGTAGNAITYTQAMTLDASGNLGIGTATIGSRLTIGDPGTGASFTNAAGGNLNIGLLAGTGSAQAYIYQRANAALLFGTNNTEVMRLDSSGNLGLGVTPSAWGSGSKALEGAYGAAVSWSTGGAELNVESNAYYNGTNWIYKTSAYATMYSSAGYNGKHAWYNAASGTAGNTITFTQAMTLDASGRLLLGTTTAPSGGSAIQVISAANGGLQLHSTSQTGGALLSSAVASGGLAFFTYTGSVGSESYTERARIDSSGNLLLGTTSVSSLSGNCFAVGVSNYAVCHATGTSSGTNYAGFLYNGSTIGSITQSGTAAVLYNTTSDRRLKDNITDADSASDLIDAIKVRQFDWKADGSHQRYGMIAQELHEVAPEAVHSPVDPDEMMAVDYSKLVPMLVKEIQSLRVRLNALESK